MDLFSNIHVSSLRPLGQSKPNLMQYLIGKRGNKCIKNKLGHMTKLATKLKFGKHLLKTNFPRTQSDLETSHAAFGTLTTTNVIPPTNVILHSTFVGAMGQMQWYYVGARGPLKSATKLSHDQ